MGLIFVEGFETQSQSTNATQIYGSSATIVTGSRGGGTNALQLAAGSSPNVFSTGTLAGGYTYFVGFTLVISSMTTFTLLSFIDGSITHGYIALNSSGLMVVYNGTGSILGTVQTPINPGQWYFVEVRYTCDSINGYVQVKIDGVVALTLSSVNTKSPSSSQITKVHWSNAAAAANTITIDDIYVVNSTTVPPGTPSETYLGPAVVEGIFPDNIGDSSQWQPINATQNYQAVNTIQTLPGTSKYIQADIDIGNPESSDLYHFQSLATITTVNGVSIIAVAYGNAATLGITVSRSSSVALSTQVTNPSALLPYYNWIEQNDPTISAAWTATNFNATQFGPFVIPPP